MRDSVDADIARCENCGMELTSSDTEGLCPRCLMKLAIADAGSTGDIPQAQFAPGDRIGPYEVVSLIGRGGMGEVYRARDTRLDRTVAVKLLSPDVVDNIVRRERFEREARAVSSLNHPNICSLYDVGEQDDTPFLVMEYVEGQTLAERLGRGTLPIEHVLRYAAEIVDALDHAHSRGIVHRDLKPANVMLTRAGVKLLDFGVAKLKGRAPIAGGASAAPQPPQAITEDGAVIGTLQYMAPEQLEARDADQRTDIFAFGAVVYEMATGQRAFGGSNRASVMAAILGHHPSPRSVVRGEMPLLDEIVTRCLAKSPIDRWQTANDLKQALARVTDARARIDGRASSWSPRRMPRGWVAAAAIAVLTSLSVMAVIVASRSVPTDTRPFRFIVPPPGNANFNQSSAFMAVSPDGHSLAFVASSRDGNDALWIRSLDSLDARQLPGTDGGAQPFWSSDSRFLAFGVVGGAMDTLRNLNVTSGSSQTISGSRAAPGAWNDEGVILFPGGRERGGVLYQIRAAGGSPAPATSLDEARGETNHNWPHFLPDGRHFIFLARSAQPEHDGVTYVGSLDSADRVRLIRADSHAVYAPQGYLLFLQVNTLVAQTFDPATLRLTGEPVPIAEQVERTPGTLRGAFSISRTGVLAYRPIGETRLAWYDRAGRQLQSIGPAGPYSNPALSPDERQIAVGRLDFDTGASNIWVIDLARGGLASQLTFDASPEEMPLWSPDGSHIIYRSRMSLYQKAATGIGKPEVLPVRGGTALDWSRDDRSLLYYARSPNGEFDLWMLPTAADRTPVGVLRTTFQEGYARLSPDGRWMAYVSDESGKNEVYVRAFPSGDGKRQVSTQGGLEPMWRGDGKEIFYLAPDRSLMSVVVRGGTTFEANPPTQLFETRMSVVSNPSYTRNQYVVSADGQRFLINQPTAGAPLSPITVVVNWQAALKQ